MPNLNPLRALYFCNYGSLGALFPYLPLLLAARGLDAVEISWVMVLTPTANLLVPPLWGTVADVLRARLWLLRLACLGAGGLVWLLLWADELWAILVAMGLFSFFRMPLNALSDATVYRVMGGARVDYSKVRVWGSIGFALWVLSPGLWPEATRDVAVIATTSALLLMAGLSTVPLPAPPRRRERGVLGQLGRILSRPPMALFLVATTVYYTGHSMYDVFFSLHLRRSGHDDAFIGVAWSVGVMAEILLMLAAPRFLHRLGSGPLMPLCAAIAALRWLLLSWVSGSSALLLVQPLHAVSFGLWYLSLVKHIQERAPERLRTSLQAMAQASMGTGMVVGYLAGGQLFEQLGGASLFHAAAGAAGLALLIYLTLRRWDREPAVGSSL